MNSLAPLLHVWKLAFGTLLISVVAVGGVAWWWSWQWAIALAVYCLWVNVNWWRDMKRKLLANLPETQRYEQVDIDKFPDDWDRTNLDHNTEILRGLGFEHLCDFRLQMTGLSGTRVFSRLFAHPTAHCFAELPHVANPNQTPIADSCSISSDLADGWSFTSIRTKLSGLSYMWRNPRGLWVYHPEVSIRDLFTAHLERRQELSDRIGCPVLTDLSWQTYQDHEQIASAQRRQIFRRKPIVWALWEATWFELAKPMQWLGEAASKYGFR